MNPLVVFSLWVFNGRMSISFFNALKLFSISSRSRYIRKALHPVEIPRVKQDIFAHFVHFLSDCILFNRNIKAIIDHVPIKKVCKSVRFLFENCIMVAVLYSSAP